MDFFKLCFVEDNWAYFTTAPLDKQWGDDWNDAPYEHNAGEPYEWHDRMKDKVEPYTIIKVAWEGEYVKPCGNHSNSPFSVEMINRGDIAWLRPSPWSDKATTPIPAGTTLEDFIRLVNKGGGKVYKQVDEVDQ